MTTSNSWRQLISPRDNVPGTHALYVHERGDINRWQRIGGQWQVTQLRPDGSERHVTGRTRDEALAALAQS